MTTVPEAKRAAWRAVGIVVLSLFVAIYAWWPVLAAWENTQWGDGQAFHKLVEAARWSLVRYKELPLWDPYECGGRPLWDNPQSMASSPIILFFTPLLGTGKTMKLWYILHTAAGFASMWLFCRRDLKVQRAAAFAGATAWACCGFNMHHMSGGHASFVAFEFMPVALLLWREAETKVASAIWLGFVIAIASTTGGALPLLYIAVLLGGETLARIWPPKRLLAVLKAGAITLAVTLGVGAARLLPTIDQLMHHKRALGQDLDHMTVQAFFDAFLNRHIGHMAHAPGLVYVWGEYAAYIGWILFVLAIAGVILGGLEHAWLFAIGLLGCALMTGYWSPYSPWGILNKYVYPLKEMRVPGRFGAHASLVLIAYAALATDRLGPALRRIVARIPRLRSQSGLASALRLVVLLVAVLGAGDVVGRGMQLVHEMGAGSGPQRRVPASKNLFYGGEAGFIEGPSQNRGRLACYDEWGFYAGAPMWEGDLPQVRVVDPAATITQSSRTQNTFSVQVEAPAATTLLLNSSYDFNWRSSVGTPIERQKLLAVDIPAGTHTIKVRYWPRTLTIGLILTLFTTLISIRALRRIARGQHPLR